MQAQFVFVKHNFNEERRGRERTYWVKPQHHLVDGLNYYVLMKRNERLQHYSDE
jgi:hypothetical protein